MKGASPVDNYMSKYLEDFLSFLDGTEELYSMQRQNLSDRNGDQEDLLHYIELGKADGKTRLALYSKFQRTRKERRRAKDDIAICEPIVEWITKNKPAINSLRNLLGSVRKIENRQANRSYAIRGHILDDITSFTHLTNNGGGID